MGGPSERIRIQGSQLATNQQPFASTAPARVSSAGRPGETPSGSVAAAPTIAIEPNEIAPSKVRAHGTHQPIKWAWLIAVTTLTLVIAWMLNRAVSGPARIPLGLQVVSREKQLEIHWNQTRPIRNATKGVMRISDGGIQEVIEFDVTQLRDGGVHYSPMTNDVNVRLEVSGLDGTSSSESVRSVAIPYYRPQNRHGHPVLIQVVLLGMPPRCQFGDLGGSSFVSRCGTARMIHYFSWRTRLQSGADLRGQRQLGERPGIDVDVNGFRLANDLLASGNAKFRDCRE